MTSAEPPAQSGAAVPENRTEIDEVVAKVVSETVRRYHGVGLSVLLMLIVVIVAPTRGPEAVPFVSELGFDSPPETAPPPASDSPSPMVSSPQSPPAHSTASTTTVTETPSTTTTSAPGLTSTTSTTSTTVTTTTSAPTSTTTTTAPPSGPSPICSLPVISC